MFTPTGAFKPWTSTLVVVVAMGLLIFFTIAYVTRQQRLADARHVQDERKICKLIVLIDDRNQKLPPADPDTMDFRRELHTYRDSLGC